MSFARRRSDRPDPARRGLGSSLERLEGRELLSTARANPFAPWMAVSDLQVLNPITHQPEPLSLHPLADQAKVNPNAPFVNNQGKVVSGKDRVGNEYTITVHGPGTVIVTDTSPQDGVLDDNIDTIQLIGTDPNKTYVTGTVNTSARAHTDNPLIGTVLFNKLVDVQGVKSVVLNGFTLEQTTTPTSGGAGTGIFLLGGTQLLQFHNINFAENTSEADQTPVYSIIIGDPSTPLPAQVQPSIRLDEIFNTVVGGIQPAPITPLTTPTVTIQVNGVLHDLSFISASRGNPTNPATGFPYTAGEQFLLPKTGVTGRTAVQAKAIDNLDVRGAANNFTASRSVTPFQNGFSGLAHLGHARFHGPTDAVGLDVTDGTIGTLKFDKGLGNPTGTSLSATSTGLPANERSYAANGFVSGLVTAKTIHHVTANPANVTLQTATNPDFVQLRTTGEPYYFARPGNALTSAAIVSSLSTGTVKIRGNTVNSEVKTGFHYPSFAAGLEGTRAPSSISSLKVNGDFVNGVVSSTVRPNNHRYAVGVITRGPGTIRGNVNGVPIQTTGTTPLGNNGAGVFARRKIGYLPPVAKPNRVNGVLVR
jgi:hypothetical protein